MKHKSIAGAKPTHDSAVALFHINELAFVIELEKVGNHPRYATMERLEQVTELLTEGTVAAQDIGRCSSPAGPGVACYCKPSSPLKMSRCAR